MTAYLLQPGVNTQAATCALLSAGGSVSDVSPESAPLGLVPLGSVEYCRAYAARHGRRLPEIEAYPRPLWQHMHRRVQRDWFDLVADGWFVRPMIAKAFDAGIKHQIANPPPPATPVWSSEPVEWVAEWRCYVLNREVVGVAQYGEGDDRDVNMDVVRQMVRDYGWRSGYALDVGLLSTGQTALVEVNDAWALGYYPGGTCSRDDYLRVVSARWLEMMR